MAFAWHDPARLGDPWTAERPLRSLVEHVDGELIPTFAAHATALAAGDAAGLGCVGAAFEQMGALLYAAEAAAASARLHRDERRTGSATLAAAQARRLADQYEGEHMIAVSEFEPLPD